MIRGQAAIKPRLRSHAWVQSKLVSRESGVIARLDLATSILEMLISIDGRVYWLSRRGL
jgi:hypothetical protein